MDGRYGQAVSDSFCNNASMTFIGSGFVTHQTNRIFGCEICDSL